MNRIPFKTALLAGAFFCGLSSASFAKEIKCPTVSFNMWGKDAPTCATSGSFQEGASCTFTPVPTSDDGWSGESVKVTLDPPHHSVKAGKLIFRYKAEAQPIIDDELECKYTVTAKERDGTEIASFTAYVERDVPSESPNCRRVDDDESFECD